MSLDPDTRAKKAPHILGTAGKRPRLAKPTKPRLDAATTRGLDAFIRGFAAATPEERRAAAATMLNEHPADVAAAVIDRVIATLLRATSPDEREALTDTLVAFGPRAVNAVTLSLVKATSGTSRAVLAGVLERMVPVLPAGARTSLALHLQIVLGRVAEPEAVEAVARAIAAIRGAAEPSRG